MVISMFMACAHAFEACDEMSSVGCWDSCADISSARCSVVGSCCCRQLGLEGFYCCGVNSIRQFVPLPCCSGEERVVVVILGAHLDGQKVGHFLITIQKSFKLIINQLWTWNGNSDESGFILKHFSWIHFNLFLKKVSISLWKLCLKLTKCVTIEYSFNEIFWLSLQWLGHM